MLEVELDILSGMPNPVWLLSRNEEQELIERVTADPGQASPVATNDEQFSLGYRGLIVRRIKPDDDPWERASLASGESLPDEFRLGSRPVSQTTAEWLMRTSEPSHKRSRVTDELRAAAAEGVALVQPSSEAPDPAAFTGPRIADLDDPETGRFPVLDGEGADTPSPPSTAAGSVFTGGIWYACNSNYFSANASFFNDPSTSPRTTAIALPAIICQTFDTPDPAAVAGNRPPQSPARE